MSMLQIMSTSGVLLDEEIARAVQRQSRPVVRRLDLHNGIVRGVTASQITSARWRQSTSASNRDLM